MNFRSALSLPPLSDHRDEIFRHLVESVHDYAIFMLDTEGVIASWNPGAQRIKGYAANEIIGRHFSIFYKPEALKADWPAKELQHARELGRFEDEGWRIRKDGSQFWANVVITAIRDDNGELLGFSKITRDLTERQRHQWKLEESEESLRLLVEGVKDYAIFMLDAKGVVQGWNAGAQRVLGFRQEEVVGREASIFYMEDDVYDGKPQTELDIARSIGFSEAVGWRKKADGTTLWADVTLTALYDRNNKLRGFAQIVHDLTERRRVQQLETEGQRISEFIAMLSHELRNPLAPIGNTVSILKTMSDTPELARHAELIGRQVMHLSRLVDDLLDVSRITSGKIQLRKEPVDLNGVLRAAIDSMRFTLESYGHTFELHLPHQPTVINGDATRLTQVIVNLLSNAAKYTHNGGHIQIELTSSSSMATLRVADNGIGMSETLMANVFELFVQGNRGLDRSEGGLGIGLTLVKSIVTMHGGTVSVLSEGVERGSAFTVTFPMAVQKEIAPSEATPAQTPARGGRKILVVDDNRDAADSIATLLQLSGHEVTVAYDGSEALRVATSNPIDIVLLDLGLPTMTGYEVARRMREIPTLRNARLIAMTGYGQDSDKRAAVDAGFEMHLVKPVEFGNLMRIIDAL
ncbi:MAG TPA: PAS domain S-box protein [Rhodocyclaceae bacterium]|nr:PAS domain S-box protein [Rhodocyclaceae bacterium]